MILNILRALGFSVFITIIYQIAANISYYLFHGETMFANLHGYSWVEYSIAGGILFLGVFLFDLTRRLLTDAVSAVGYGVVVTFVYLAITANVVNYFFFKNMMFQSMAQYAIVLGIIIVSIVIVEGVRRVAGKKNG